MKPRPLPFPDCEQFEAFDPFAIVRSWHRDQEICSQAAPADNWYRVIAGIARRHIVRRDGRRQIIGLLLPGDFFGFATRATHAYAVEAVGRRTVVATYSRRRLEAVADADPHLAREIRRVTFLAMSHLESQLLILGRVTAVEKVGSFILEMESRLASQSMDNVELPVSRYDIADYLAMSVETVSRSLTHLKDRGVITFSGARNIRIVNRSALEEGEDRAVG